MALYSQVFSRYDMRKMGVKIFGETNTPAFASADCVGKWEEELDVINVTKKCRGVVVKQKPRGAGTGTVTFTGHIPYAIYAKIHDMVRGDLKADVQGYGNANFHKEFAITADIFDEDNVEMLVCYPRCIINTAPQSSIENGAEEVAEVEMEIALMPDAHGYCKYEVMASSLPSGTTANDWMQNWTDEMVIDDGSCDLSALTFGSISLSPSFDPDKISYTASTTTATNTITATAAESGATVVIKNGDTPVTSGSSATWVSGANTVTITVSNGGKSKTYTVIVTKS